MFWVMRTQMSRGGGLSSLSARAHTGQLIKPGGHLFTKRTLTAIFRIRFWDSGNSLIKLKPRDASVIWEENPFGFMLPQGERNGLRNVEESSIIKVKLTWVSPDKEGQCSSVSAHFPDTHFSPIALPYQGIQDTVCPSKHQENKTMWSGKITPDLKAVSIYQ